MAIITPPDRAASSMARQHPTAKRTQCYSPRSPLGIPCGRRNSTVKRTQPYPIHRLPPILLAKHHILPNEANSCWQKEKAFPLPPGFPVDFAPRRPYSCLRDRRSDAACKVSSRPACCKCGAGLSGAV